MQTHYWGPTDIGPLMWAFLDPSPQLHSLALFWASMSFVGRQVGQFVLGLAHLSLPCVSNLIVSCSLTSPLASAQKATFPPHASHSYGPSYGQAISVFSLGPPPPFSSLLFGMPSGPSTLGLCPSPMAILFHFNKIVQGPGTSLAANVKFGGGVVIAGDNRGSKKNFTQSFQSHLYLGAPGLLKNPAGKNFPWDPMDSCKKLEDLGMRSVRGEYYAPNHHHRRTQLRGFSANWLQILEHFRSAITL